MNPEHSERKAGGGKLSNLQLIVSSAYSSRNTQPRRRRKQSVRVRPL